MCILLKHLENIRQVEENYGPTPVRKLFQAPINLIFLK